MKIDTKLTQLKEIATAIPVIGTYTRPNQSKIKAVWVGDEPPVNYIVEGIEVIIRVSEINYYKSLGNNVVLNFCCEVAFVNHGTTFPKDFIETYSPSFLKDCWRTETNYSAPTQKTLGEYRIRLFY